MAKKQDKQNQTDPTTMSPINTMEEEHKSDEYYFSPKNSRSRRSMSSLGYAIPASPLRRHPQTTTPQQQEDDFGWITSWDDTVETSAELWQQQQQHSLDMTVVDSLPPQLHPAVSLGMKRVSSCAYFSLQGSVSEADLHSLSSEYATEVAVQLEQHHQAGGGGGGCGSGEDTHHHHRVVDADWLYHDVITQVLTFLDASSLAAFSETARRCNFECFYFLQLQLQRALLEDNLHHHHGLLSLPHDEQQQQPQRPQPQQQEQQDDRLAAIAGSWSISRLASLDKHEAESVVQEYLDSNSTLRTMPLSHSLAYIRQVLRRNGFPGGPGESQAFTTSAAVLIGLVGAATVMSGNVNVEVVESFGTELPNMLFKVGFVGSLMGAARHRWEHTAEGGGGRSTSTTTTTATNTGAPAHPSMRETAGQMARTMQHVRRTGTGAAQPTTNDTSTMENNTEHPQSQDLTGTQLPPGPAQQQQPHEGSISQRMYEAFLAASGRPSSSDSDASDDEQDPTNPELQEQLPELLGPNPYEHLPSAEEKT